MKPLWGAVVVALWVALLWGLIAYRTAPPQALRSSGWSECAEAFDSPLC